MDIINTYDIDNEYFLKLLSMSAYFKYIMLFI